MTRSEFYSKLLTLDPKLAVKALKNEKLTARLKVAALLNELKINVQTTNT